MVSLRSRLLAAVLVLSAVGMLLLGAITYAEQRSFQFQRIDDQARAAPPSAAHALADVGVGPAFDNRDPDRGGPGGPPPGGGPQHLLPQGTYVERRNAAGKSLGHNVADYSQDVTANPALPAHMPLNHLFTVHGRNGDEKRYRVYATADPSGFGGTTIVAIPLTEVDQTLHRLRDSSSAASSCSSASPRGRSSASGSCRSTAWATPPARSPAATSPTGSSRPTRAPRSAAWASR
jgi:two-component system OmpR family sensor kinase